MLRNTEINIPIKRESEIALHVQVAQALLERIKTGLLSPGTLLPGSRELSERLGVNRKTIVIAYEELIAQGWLSAQGKRGTFVSPQLPVVVAESKSAQQCKAAGGKLAKAAYKLNPASMELPNAIASGVIEFTDGAPDTRLIPFEVLSRAFRHGLIASSHRNRLAYADPRGLDKLRELLAVQLRNERGLNASSDTICLVRGSQMGIYLAARVLVKPGEKVAMERLTYPPARAAFKDCGAEIIPIEQDEYGLVPASLEKICSHHRIRAIYVTPHHQFPTTVTLPVERRLRLLALAEQFDFVIIEDDYDNEFHFAHNPMLPVASVDRFGKVIYIASFSKIMAPGLRLGYVVAPAEVINRFAMEIMLIDRQGNTITEHAIAELMQAGELKRHIRRATRVYEERHKFMIDLVGKELHQYARFYTPEGGLALWLRLNPDTDMELLERDALADRVSILSGSRFADGAARVAAMRLGFGSLNETELQTGIARLKRALDNQGLLFAAP